MCATPKFAWFLALAILLAGCAPGSATLIASYPQTMANPRPQPTALNNSSRLALEVDDVPFATTQAIDLALTLRRVRGRPRLPRRGPQVANLILGVPASSAERLRRALSGLGQVVDQTSWTDHSGCITCAEVSYIYLELTPRPPAWVDKPPAPRNSDWSPAWTFQTCLEGHRRHFHLPAGRPDLDRRGRRPVRADRAGHPVPGPARPA